MEDYQFEELMKVLKSIDKRLATIEEKVDWIEHYSSTNSYSTLDKSDLEEVLSKFLDSK